MNARKRKVMKEGTQLGVNNTEDVGGLQSELEENANTAVKLYDSRVGMLGQDGHRSGEIYT